MRKGHLDPCGLRQHLAVCHFAHIVAGHAQVHGRIEAVAQRGVMEWSQNHEKSLALQQGAAL